MNPFTMFYNWLYDIRPCEHHWEVTHKETKCALEKLKETGKDVTRATHAQIMELTQYNIITVMQCSTCGEVRQKVTPSHNH